MKTFTDEKIIKDLSERLVLERERLGLPQETVRDTLGVAHATFSRYENAKRLPDLGLAKKLSDIGYDISYVVTGKRLDESASDLTDDEVQVLELYRHSKRRAELMRLMKAHDAME